MNQQMSVGGYTAEDIVKKYIELRDYVQEETKAFKGKIKAYQDGMDALEAAAAALMSQTKQTALQTSAGTAYREPQMSVTCQDKTAFHEWVRKNGNWQFLTAHVSKEAVEQYMEGHEGHTPPHLKVDTYNAVRFRRR